MRHRIPLRLSIIPTNYRISPLVIPSRINSPSAFPQRSLFPSPTSRATPLRAEAAGGGGGGRGGVKLKQALRTLACGALWKHKTERSGVWEGPTLGSVPAGPTEVVPAEMLGLLSSNGRTQRQGRGERGFCQALAPASASGMLDDGHGGPAKPCASPALPRPHKGPQPASRSFLTCAWRPTLRTHSATGRSPALQERLQEDATAPRALTAPTPPPPGTPG